MALVRLAVVLSALLVLWPSTAAARQAGPPVATAEIRLDQPGATIAPEIYGQFMEQLGTGIDGGVWVGPENSLRDGLLAAVNFNIFHRHANRVRMANVAQMVNVLQAVILTDGPRMVLTPTYHAFAMYQRSRAERFCRLRSGHRTMSRARCAWLWSTARRRRAAMDG